jgi:recombination protein RecA
MKVIEKSGAWYAFDGERMGQGRENARQFLKDNADVRTEVDTRLRKGMGLPVVEKEAPAAKHDKADVVPMPEKKKA